MEVIFYNNSSDNEEVHKRLTQIVSKDCQLTESCSLTNPNLIITYSDDLINANYCYIPKWNRYYYIVDKVIQDGSILICNCRVDVLMSHWNSFKGSQCIAYRSASHYNPYIIDNNMIRLPIRKRVSRRLSGSFNPTSGGFHYMLTVGGGN